MKSLNSLQPLALLLLRAAIGVIFITHGYPKIAGHAAAMQGFFVQHGLPAYFVYVAGILEVFGGGLLIIGLFTRWAGLLLAIEMAVAIWKVHSGGGILAVNNYEFPLTLLVACFALATLGAGSISIDNALLGEGGRRSQSPKPAKK